MFKLFFDVIGQLASKANGRQVVHAANGFNQDIREALERNIPAATRQVREVARQLKGYNTEQTARKIYNWLKSNIRYKADPPNRQSIRMPARLAKDQVGDCKSYTLFTAAICQALGQPYLIRYAAYKPGATVPTHVYPVLLDRNGREVIADAVYNRFNAEKPYTFKQDKRMQVETLSGWPEKPQCTPAPPSAESKKINKVLVDRIVNDMVNSGDPVKQDAAIQFVKAQKLGPLAGKRLEKAATALNILKADTTPTAHNISLVTGEEISPKKLNAEIDQHKNELFKADREAIKEALKTLPPESFKTEGLDTLTTSAVLAQELGGSPIEYAVAMQSPSSRMVMIEDESIQGIGAVPAAVMTTGAVAAPGTAAAAAQGVGAGSAAAGAGGSAAGLVSLFNNFKQWAGLGSNIANGVKGASQAKQLAEDVGVNINEDQANWVTKGWLQAPTVPFRAIGNGIGNLFRKARGEEPKKFKAFGGKGFSLGSAEKDPPPSEMALSSAIRAAIYDKKKVHWDGGQVPDNLLAPADYLKYVTSRDPGTNNVYIGPQLPPHPKTGLIDQKSHAEKYGAKATGGSTAANKRTNVSVTGKSTGAFGGGKDNINAAKKAHFDSLIVQLQESKNIDEYNARLQKVADYANDYSKGHPVYDAYAKYVADGVFTKAAEIVKNRDIARGYFSEYSAFTTTPSRQNFADLAKYGDALPSTHEAGKHWSDNKAALKAAMEKYEAEQARLMAQYNNDQNTTQRALLSKWADAPTEENFKAYFNWLLSQPDDYPRKKQAIQWLYDGGWARSFKQVGGTITPGVQKIFNAWKGKFKAPPPKPLPGKPLPPPPIVGGGTRPSDGVVTAGAAFKPEYAIPLVLLAGGLFLSGNKMKF